MTNHSSSAGQFRLLNQHLQKNGAAKHCIMYYKSDISSLWSIMAVPNLQCWHFNRKQVFPHPIIHLLSTGITLLVSWEFQDGLLQDRCLHFNGLFPNFYWRPQKTKQQPSILLLYQQHTGKVHALVNGWYKAFKLIQHVSIICQWTSATTVYTNWNLTTYEGIFFLSSRPSSINITLHSSEYAAENPQGCMGDPPMSNNLLGVRHAHTGAQPTISLTIQILDKCNSAPVNNYHMKSTPFNKTESNVYQWFLTATTKCGCQHILFKQ